MFIENLPYKIPNKNQFNYAQINNFYVVALQLQDIAFYTQQINLPDINMLAQTEYDTPFNPIPLVGTKLEYAPLRCKFIINENFQNYGNINDWLKNITFPQDNNQFIDQLTKNKGLIPGQKNVEKLLQSDLHVVALNSNNNPVLIIEYKDAFPISLSGLNWSATDSTTEYFTADVSFKYLYYKFLRIE